MNTREQDLDMDASLGVARVGVRGRWWMIGFVVTTKRVLVQ